MATLTRSITYAQLVAAIGASGLHKGESITITDFATRHYLTDGLNTQAMSDDEVPVPEEVTGTTETIIVHATSVNTLDKRVQSVEYPQDIIEYDWNPANWLDNINFATDGVLISDFKGVIVFRHDTINNNSSNHDWRTAKNRVWNIEQPAWSSGVYDVGDFVQYTDSCIYCANESVLEGEEPGTSTKWDKLIDLTTRGGYTSFSSTSFTLGTYTLPIVDASDYQDMDYLGTGCYNNTFPESNVDYGGIISRIPLIVLGDSSYNNVFSMHDMAIIGMACDGNTFGTGVVNLHMGSGCFANHIGNESWDNTLGNTCESNIFGNECCGNLLGVDCSNNVFTNDSNSNILGVGCQCNLFSTGSGTNILGDNCSGILFGPASQFISIGTSSGFISIGPGSEYISLPDGTANLEIAPYVSNGSADLSFVAEMSTETTSKKIITDSSGNVVFTYLILGEGYTWTYVPLITPLFVSATTNEAGTKAILTFDSNMADPSANPDDIIISVGGTPVTITGIALGVDITTIEVSPTVAFIFGDVVTFSTVKGNIRSENGLLLEIQEDQSITNIVPE